MIFGTEVNQDFVKCIPQFAQNEVTPLLLSQVALLQQTAPYSNGDTLQMTATKQVSAMEEDCDIGFHIGSTMVMVFNASGEPLTFLKNYDFVYVFDFLERNVGVSTSGSVSKYPLDPTIPNGMYSIFVHVGDDSDSVGAVVYKGTTGTEFFLRWNSHLGTQTNTVYGGVVQPDTEDDMWNNFNNKLAYEGESTVTTHDGPYSIFSSIGSATSDIACFVITRNA